VNLSQLRTHVRTLTGIQSTDLLSDADLNVFINEAYQDICRSHDWPFLRNDATLNISPGVASYTLPAGVEENSILSAVILTNDANRRQLQPRAQASVDRSPGTVSQARPNEYSCWRGSIQLHPTPNIAEVVTLRYFSSPTDMANDSDVPVFGTNYHTAIAYGAAVKVLIREGDDTERRAFYSNSLQTFVEAMRSDLLVERDRSVFRLGGRRETKPSRNRYYGV